MDYACPQHILDKIAACDSTPDSLDIIFHDTLEWLNNLSFIYGDRAQIPVPLKTNNSDEPDIVWQLEWRDYDAVSRMH